MKKQNKLSIIKNLLHDENFKAGPNLFLSYLHELKH